jgi:hypothetical protein
MPLEKSVFVSKHGQERTDYRVGSWGADGGGGRWR